MHKTLIEQHPLNLSPQFRKNAQNVNKVKGGKCKKGPFSYFKRIYFYLLVKNEKKKSFFQKKGYVAEIKCCNKSENKSSREVKSRK